MRSKLNNIEMDYDSPKGYSIKISNNWKFIFIESSKIHSFLAIEKDLGEESFVLSKISSISIINNKKTSEEPSFDLENLFKFSNLKKLCIKYTKIESIPTEKFPNVQILEFRDPLNPEKYVQLLESFPNVAVLSLHGFELTDIDFLEKYTCLMELNIGGNPIKKISIFKSLKFLVDINFGYAKNSYNPSLNDLKDYQDYPIGVVFNLFYKNKHLTENISLYHDIKRYIIKHLPEIELLLMLKDARSGDIAGSDPLKNFFQYIQNVEHISSQKWTDEMLPLIARIKYPGFKLSYELLPNSPNDELYRFLILLIWRKAPDLPFTVLRGLLYLYSSQKLYRIFQAPLFLNGVPLNLNIQLFDRFISAYLNKIRNVPLNYLNTLISDLCHIRQHILYGSYLSESKEEFSLWIDNDIGERFGGKIAEFFKNRLCFDTDFYFEWEHFEDKYKLSYSFEEITKSIENYMYHQLND